MGEIVSELLAEALMRRRALVEPPLEWVSRPMHALIDLAEKGALRDDLDQDNS